MGRRAEALVERAFMRDRHHAEIYGKARTLSGVGEQPKEETIPTFESRYAGVDGTRAHDLAQAPDIQRFSALSLEVSERLDTLARTERNTSGAETLYHELLGLAKEAITQNHSHVHNAAEIEAAFDLAEGKVQPPTPRRRK